MLQRKRRDIYKRRYQGKKRSRRGRQVLKHEAVLGRGRRNPYRQEHVPKIGMRVKIAVLILALMASFGLLLYHPFFTISHVDIRGLERIGVEEFEASVQGVIDFPRYFVLPGNNYFMLNLTDVQEIIMQKYPIEGLRIEKQFPGKVLIEVQEKISTVIYDNGARYSTIGLDGNVVEALRKVGEDEWTVERKPIIQENIDVALAQEEVDVSFFTEETSTSTEEMAYEEIRTHTPAAALVMQEFGDYPVIYDLRHADDAVNTQVLSPEIVRGAITWFSAIRRETPLDFRHIELKDGSGAADIYLFSGKTIHVRLHEDVDAQIASLKYLLEEEISDQFSYIDLRYGNRVYWK